MCIWPRSMSGMFNIVNQQENANYMTRDHTSWPKPKSQTAAGVGKGVEQLGPWHSAGGKASVRSKVPAPLPQS